MEFSRKLNICLFVGLSLKALCVVMAMLTAILLQPIDEALSSLFQGEIWWLSADPILSCFGPKYTKQAKTSFEPP